MAPADTRALQGPVPVSCDPQPLEKGELQDSTLFEEFRKVLRYTYIPYFT